jgi:sugar phosphate permease
MLLGVLISGITFALRASTSSIWFFFIMYFLGAIGIAFAGNVPLNTIVANWFVKKRGLAMGIKATGIGWRGLIMVPVATWLILDYGWRTAYTSIGMGVLLINIPIVLLLMRWLKPEDKGLLPDGKSSPAQETSAETGRTHKEEAPNSGWTLKSASRIPAFHLLWLSIYLVFVGQASIMFHGIPLFEDRGASAQVAASLMSTVALLGIVGKLLTGYAVDRLTARSIAIVVFCLYAVALVVFLVTEGVSILWLFVIMYGLVMGGLTTLAPLLVGQYFGRASFGTIFGTVSIAMTAGVATGPMLMGYVYDATGTYNPALMAYIGTFLLSALLILLASPAKLTLHTPSTAS